MYNKYIRGRIEKNSTQLVLLILIIFAMIEFMAVSFITYGTLKKIQISGTVIKSFLLELTFINISMAVLFLFIILMITRIFKKINTYAFYNHTTGLPNKNYVVTNLVEQISRIRDFSALISLDMDNFKAVNDTLGHLSGDELLKQAGRRLKKVIQLQDCVCHIGGDEFLFFIKSARDRAEVEKISKELISAFEEPFDINGKNVDYVTASIGIALIPQDGNDFQTIYNCADDAMYNAKRSGKNGYKFYDKSMNLHIYENSVRRKELEYGIRNKEFKVFYQPKVSREGIVIGAEALVRWVKNDGAILPPSEFIDFAEKNGLIVFITEIVINEVCNKILYWIKKGYDNFTISINITAEHLINEKLCGSIIETIKALGIPARYIEFEITESMIIKDLDIAVKNINIIKDSGIKISMDDFGTGYSSLNYLQKLPIDSVKIDKSFIDKINEEEKNRSILENIINIAHIFSHYVVAEGVENKEQYEILKGMECDMFQGYYFGKPVDENTFEIAYLNKLNSKII